MTELLVVIGIIILVVGIAMPSLTRAWRTADRTRTAGDLQAIAAALEAYRQDHGDYPRVRFDTALAPNIADRPNPPSGAQILCQALVAPAPATEMGGAAAGRRKQDGADGPGFRTRGTTGRVYGPYLPPEKFKIRTPGVPAEPNPPGYLTMCILDRYDRPILYFPASTAKPNITINEGGRPGFVHTDTPTANGPQSEFSLYDADDNLAPPYFQRTAGDPEGIRRIRLMLGDRNTNGIIEAAAGESAATTAPFLLWSSGPDELFGPNADLAAPVGTLDAQDVPRCDDVTNFNM
jgi:type II secretory pathway pseudopilin PulG